MNISKKIYEIVKLLCWKGEINIQQIQKENKSEDIKTFPNQINIDGQIIYLEREFINNGAVLVNGEQQKSLEFTVLKENAIGNKYTVVRRGKKNYYLLKH